LKGESYEKRAAKRQKARKIAQKRFEEERMAALESEALAAASNSFKNDEVSNSDIKSAIDVSWQVENSFFLGSILFRIVLRSMLKVYLRIMIHLTRISSRR